MKRLFSILFLVFIFSTPLVAQRTVAVATFDVLGNAVNKDEAESITELYIEELRTIGRMVIVNPVKFNKTLRELKFQDEDFFDVSKLKKLGDLINAEVISRGKIMKLGTKLYLSATLIEIKTAEILSISKMEMGSLSDIPDLLARFVSSLKANYSPVKIKGGWYVGATGPGGGMVFNIEGNIAWEVSEWLGETNWYDAWRMCEEYRGGGYSDWYFPNAEELDLIDDNLGKTQKLTDYGWYHSSTSYEEDDDYVAWGTFYPHLREFGGSVSKEEKLNIRAVRSFDISTIRKTMNIGYAGPGGGMIFCIEGDKVWEVSERLGSATWNDAKTRCHQYRGGGYDDWYLPTKEELNLICENLVKTGKLEDYGEAYWSSSALDSIFAWLQFFSNEDNSWSGGDYYYTISERGVRAVRTFIVSNR